eukprot:CAMPEP_0174363330 /NCGR_PEP_ID=MMETSP0811_2-20130205/68404_1 /TAXON_ID=73025 ORGANISM="Eutreptiella gymnastica-like, Strain CCMP1594" /NCGR_SAMPLE_ID=MMETSP0811_2 /ASSEMBLY_ACC=CAM_ASM_000667 /LENGTH=153 /DNA_ID=CAMNT_0015501933 /DNA_START=20 /DNA_END=481 /DNA_ORIENTATION=-
MTAFYVVTQWNAQSWMTERGRGGRSEDTSSGSVSMIWGFGPETCAQQSLSMGLFVCWGCCMLPCQRLGPKGTEMGGTGPTSGIAGTITTAVRGTELCTRCSWSYGANNVPGMGDKWHRPDSSQNAAALLDQWPVCLQRAEKCNTNETCTEGGG